MYILDILYVHPVYTVYTGYSVSTGYQQTQVWLICLFYFGAVFQLEFWGTAPSVVERLQTETAEGAVVCHSRLNWILSTVLCKARDTAAVWRPEDQQWRQEVSELGPESPGAETEISLNLHLLQIEVDWLVGWLLDWLDKDQECWAATVRSDKHKSNPIRLEHKHRRLQSKPASKQKIRCCTFADDENEWEDQTEQIHQSMQYCSGECVLCLQCAFSILPGTASIKAASESLTAGCSTVASPPWGRRCEHNRTTSCTAIQQHNTHSAARQLNFDQWCITRCDLTVLPENKKP